MTFATTSTAQTPPPLTLARRAGLWLAGTMAALMVLLIGLPDGVAEPLQTVLGWSVVALVAALAVLAVAKGLDLLLDSETS
jgi:hypothetical protein